ncbi:MAG: zinc-finger domain-containing protein [Alphaproteobacteria bacterium]|nr:zinc-finger domain-containing protein [Alphaproteobacteria bacterium]
MQPVETVEVESPRVSCDGGNGALGHPRIYLNLGDQKQIDCPYCGKRFVLKEGARAVASH